MHAIIAAALEQRIAEHRTPVAANGMMRTICNHLIDSGAGAQEMHTTCTQQMQPVPLTRMPEMP